MDIARIDMHECFVLFACAIVHSTKYGIKLLLVAGGWLTTVDYSGWNENAKKKQSLN